VIVAVVGGGPAGLYFARLAKRRHPADDVTVYEQNPAGATYGFGVALGESARGAIQAVDPDVHRRLEAAMIFNDRQNIHLNGADVLLRYPSASGAIARIELLAILQAACRDAGVRVEHNVRIEALDARVEHADVIVAADGANSWLRGRFAGEFGANVRVLTNYLAWFGLGRPLSPNGLCFRSVDGGHFVGHYYAYSDTMSTFVTECDAATWRRFGMEQMTDEERRAFMHDVFAPELGGEPLIDNNSAWRNLRIYGNERWWHGNVVLIGDALQTAHPSIGSGTRLAMEDAQALVDALAAHRDDRTAAFEHFVRERKPRRDAFALAAERSFEWYETIATVTAQPILDFTYNFLTRTGRIDDARLRTYAPEFYEDYQRYRLSRSA
jgi:2-polyprenyl-6-methoxyphenol hydroxylase-like FAD-dependent oxidoreductase